MPEIEQKVAPMPVDNPPASEAGSVVDVRTADEMAQTSQVDDAAAAFRVEIRDAELNEAATLEVEEAALLVGPHLRALINSRPTQPVGIEKETLSELAPQELATGMLVESQLEDEVKLEGRELPANAGTLMETQGFVKMAPKFNEQIEDKSRTNIFSYARGSGRNGKKGRVKTESEGLLELRNFLQHFLEEVTDGLGQKKASAFGPLAHQAENMLNNLTFVGEKEYIEASRGIAAYWKQYLDGDPSRKICVPANVGNIKRYSDKGQRKSDDYLREAVIMQFTEAEREQYAGRILGSFEEVDTPPEQTRIILLDDWTISGGQMRSVYQELQRNPKFESYAQTGSVEINLITASEKRLKAGLPLNPFDEGAGAIKLRAYYIAHPGDLESDFGGSHITGVKSAANYGFFFPCKQMRALMARIKREDLNVPALAQVVPPYKAQKPLIKFTAGHLKLLDQ